MTQKQVKKAVLGDYWVSKFEDENGERVEATPPIIISEEDIKAAN